MELMYYFSPEIFKGNFDKLKMNGNDGKKGGERTTGLVTFFAIDMVQKETGETIINLHPESDHREQVTSKFVQTLLLGEIAGVELHVNNLGTVIAEEKKLRIRFSSNFLTKSVKSATETTGTKNYPNRPVPLLTLGIEVEPGNKWGATKLDTWSSNFMTFINERICGEDTFPLIVYLLRQHPFVTTTNPTDVLTIALRTHFTDEVADYLVSHADIPVNWDNTEFFSDEEISVGFLADLAIENEEAEEAHTIHRTDTLDDEDESSFATGGYNLILYGAPGTGKSYELERRALGNVTRVTFHSEYTYHDFIGSYKPVPIYSNESLAFVRADGQLMESGQPYIDYQFVPGPFTLALKEALIQKDVLHTLKIEELNRANAAAVFGDMFQLLDRKDSGESEYRITPMRELYNYLKKNIPTLGREMYIPSNLSIFATMNSADQGVFVMDSAFKRRWNFEYMAIELDGIEHENELVWYEGRTVTWRILIESINSSLADIKINEDKHIGPYFMKKGEPSDPHRVASKLLVYLWDDVVRHSRNQFFLDEIKTFAQLVKTYKSGRRIFVFDMKQYEEETSADIEAEVDTVPVEASTENNAQENEGPSNE